MPRGRTRTSLGLPVSDCSLRYPGGSDEAAKNAHIEKGEEYLAALCDRDLPDGISEPQARASPSRHHAAAGQSPLHRHGVGGGAAHGGLRQDPEDLHAGAQLHHDGGEDCLLDRRRARPRLQGRRRRRRRVRQGRHGRRDFHDGIVAAVLVPAGEFALVDAPIVLLAESGICGLKCLRRDGGAGEEGGLLLAGGRGGVGRQEADAHADGRQPGGVHLRQRGRSALPRRDRAHPPCRERGRGHQPTRRLPLRFYAFEKAHRLDPTSSARGVRQFKTTLLQRPERENDPTLKGRVHQSDAREMQRFYREYYKRYIQALQNAADKADRALLTKAYQTAPVLFEVLKAVNVSQSVEVDQAILDTHNKVEEKKKLYVPYNILPLNPESTDQPIMRNPEIQAAVYALRNIRGLPWPKEHEKKPDEKKTDKDLLDWLQAMFGFQKDNVSNQREHLILLLANVHIRQIPKPDQQPKLDDRALDAVMKKLFKNYKKWCKYLGRKSSLWKSSSVSFSIWVSTC